jgi:hypothetical protein
MAFVAFDIEKGVLKASADPREAEAVAVYHAKRDGDPGVGLDVEGQDTGLPRRHPNPHMNPPPLVLSGLTPLSEREVMGISPEQAHQVIGKYFPVQSGRGYAPYLPGTAQPLHIVRARGFLKKNAKLEKTDIDTSLGEVPSVAFGLSLVPANFGQTLKDSNGESVFYMSQRQSPERAHGWVKARAFAEGLKVDVLRSLSQRMGRNTFNLCPSSTPECQRSCLVKTGQNDSVKNYPKLLSTFALLNHPKEFARLLIHSLDKYFWSPSPKIADAFRFVRLNVYSDIVWEEFLPWMFVRYLSRYPRRSAPGMFYDYTKIAERITAPRSSNYDLTFSYSGEAQNIQQCRQFLVNGQARCAVVFLRGLKEWKGLFAKGPTHWKGFPVVNGDRHDFRPFDPLSVWTALRWKTPKGFNVTSDEVDLVLRERAAEGRRGKVVKAHDVIKKFIIRAELEDGEWIVSEQPRHTAAVSVGGDK